MKNITKLIAVSLACIVAACSETKTVETETAPPTPQTTVVKVETKAPEKSTEISVGENGAKVETNGTKIEVKEGSTAIEIKKK